jgi:hypothetical protein
MTLIADPALFHTLIEEASAGRVSVRQGLREVLAPVHLLTMAALACAARCKINGLAMLSH